ncbi:MAG: hypothetical protein HY665_05210 [Chloroflexi bacterium]|nr:hypothetical protein [Chloroflexota bacterium]
MSDQGSDPPPAPSPKGRGDKLEQAMQDRKERAKATYSFLWQTLLNWRWRNITEDLLELAAPLCNSPRTPVRRP